MKPLLTLCAILCLSAIATADQRSHEALRTLRQYQKKLLRYQKVHAIEANPNNVQVERVFGKVIELDLYLLALEIHRYRRGDSSPEKLRRAENFVRRDFEVQPPLLAETAGMK